jgi:Holliday junction resolvase RusA-like endonuclease
VVEFKSKIMKIKIKPLSVNLVWKGQRFKTKEYKKYEMEMFYLLPKLEVPNGRLELNIIFGFSSKGSDIDNCCKPLMDILSKKYEFNDNLIYKLKVEKVDVAKGEEYIDINIAEYVLN